MPKWVEGYQAAVGDGGLVTTTLITDSNTGTYEEISIGEERDAALSGIWDLGDSPETVDDVVVSISYNDNNLRSLQYSSDGSSWTTVSLGLPTATLCTVYTESTTVTSVGVAARYWRLSVKAAVSNCITQTARINEFRLLDGSGSLIIEPGGVVPDTRRRGVQVT